MNSDNVTHDTANVKVPDHPAVRPARPAAPEPDQRLLDEHRVVDPATQPEPAWVTAERKRDAIKRRREIACACVGKPASAELSDVAARLHLELDHLVKGIATEVDCGDQVDMTDRVEFLRSVTDRLKMVLSAMWEERIGLVERAERAWRSAEMADEEVSKWQDLLQATSRRDHRIAALAAEAALELRDLVDVEPGERSHIDRHREQASRQGEELKAACESARAWRPHTTAHAEGRPA